MGSTAKNRMNRDVSGGVQNSVGRKVQQFGVFALLFGLLFLLWAPVADGQVTASIKGVITDPSGQQCHRQ